MNKCIIVRTYLYLSWYSLSVCQITMSRVAVIGAGVVGLSTSVLIQGRIPGVDVTIIADKFDKDTTSDGAAGIFRPTRGKTPGVPLPVLK